MEISRRRFLKGSSLATAALWAGVPDFSSEQPEEKETPKTVWEQAREYSRIVVARLNTMPRNLPRSLGYRSGDLDSCVSWYSDEEHHALRSRDGENNTFTYGSCQLPLDMKDFDLPFNNKNGLKGAVFLYHLDRVCMRLTSGGIIQSKSPFAGWGAVGLFYVPDEKGKVGRLVRADSLAIRLGDSIETGLLKYEPKEIDVGSIKPGDSIMGIPLETEIDYETTARKILHFSGIERAARLIAQSA